MTLDREGVSLCLGVGPDWGGAIEVGRDPSPMAILSRPRIDVNRNLASDVRVGPVQISTRRKLAVSSVRSRGRIGRYLVFSRKIGAPSGAGAPAGRVYRVSLREPC